ncbi:hypothetical protein [Ectopseudomonas composti]|uniref:hypothetical protein n=1 Tax=Ectopseudomonas composti TaxID=658457 RepID=UPI000773A83A|nr:hypothetical protein [Pseudomonas composti]
MNRPYLALVALLAFSLYTAWCMAVAEQSLLAFGLELLSRPDTAQLVIDLYLLAAMAALWMYRDARSKGRSLLSILPYLVLTAVFASIGPLAYMVVEGFWRQRPMAQRV